jgi:hypothetical protein
MPTRLVYADDSIFPDFLTSCPAVLPDALLPPWLRTPAHKPDFIRLLELKFSNTRTTSAVISQLEKNKLGNGSTAPILLAPVGGAAGAAPEVGALACPSASPHLLVVGTRNPAAVPSLA